MAVHLWRRAEQIAPRGRGLHLRQSVWRAAVKHLPAIHTCGRAHVHNPVRMADHIHLVFHHEYRITGRLELIQCAEQGLRIGRMQASRGLVHHVHHAEQLRTDLRGQAQTLQFARRQRGRAALQREIPQAQRLHHRDARAQVFGNALRGDYLFGMFGCSLALAFALRGLRGGCGFGGRAQQLGHLIQRALRQRADIQPGKGHRQRLAAQPLAIALRALRADQILRHALFHLRALRAGKGVQHVAPRTGEGAHVAGLFLALERAPDLAQVVAGIHRHHRLLVGVENPVARFLRQLGPWHVHINPERGEDVALVLPMPRARPGGHRALADAQAAVRHHAGLGGVVDTPQAVAGGAGTGRRIRRKPIRINDLLPRRVLAGARIQHAQRLEMVVTLPTEERALGAPRACCSATAGGRPSMASTSGTPTWSIRRRAYGEIESR